jgi:hypothetical protein
VDCVGAFGACSATACGTSGVKTYAITRAAVGTGNACPYSSGATQSCSAPPCYSNCTGAPCFVAGTPVLMADGHYKAIEKMQAGDEVVSYDEHQQTQRIDKVLYPTAHQAQWQRLHHFQLVDGTKFTSNAIHPFYVVEKDYWFEAHEISSMLKQGQRISLLNINNKPILIKKISIEHKKVRVYNIEVHGISSYDEKYGKWGRGHSYYVKGVLTHNKYAVQACIAVAPGDPYEVACSGCASGWINTGGACIKCPTGKVYTSGMCCVPGGTVFDP